MSVKIPVQADVQNAVRSFDDIRTAIERVGQAGRQIKDIDFSHPELQGMEEDLRRVQQRWEELLRVRNSALAREARKKVGTGEINGPLDLLNPSFSAGEASGRYGDQLPAHLRRILFSDEGLRPPPPPGASGPAPAGGGGGSSGGGGGETGPAGETPEEADADQEEAEAEGRRRPRGGGGSGSGDAGGGGNGLDALSVIGGPARLAAGAVLGAAGLRGGLGVVTSHMGDAEREMVANDGLMRRVSDTGESFDELLHTVRATSQSIHVLQTEGQALTEQWVRITSETRGAAVAASVTFAGSAARGFGVAPSLMVGGLAQARNQGEDPRHFAMLLGEAMHQGNMGGQLENVMQAMLRWSENANRMGYEHADTASFAALYAGMNAAGSPQLRGSNAENLINQENGALSSGGGGGLAGQVLMYQAARRHGVTNLDRWRVLQSEGMFARLPDGTTIRDAAHQAINQMYGNANRDRRALAGAALTGLTPAQYLAQENVSSADLEGTNRYLSSVGISLEKVNPTGIAGITAALAPHADLAAIRSQLLARRDLLGADATALRTATSGDEMRRAIVSTYAHSGMQGSMGQDIINANANLSNTLTNAASLLVGPVTALKDAVSSINGPVQKIAEALNTDGTGGYDATLAAPAVAGAADTARDAAVDAAGGGMSHGWLGGLSTRFSNNPLNLMFNNQAGAAGAAGHVARFDSLENGLAAAGWQLLRNQDIKGQRTIADLVRGWDTSPEDAPKLPGYITDVGRRLGVDPYKPYSLRSGNNLERIEDAMAHDEVGHGIDDAGALRRSADRARARDVNVHLHGGVVTVRVEDQHGNLKAQKQVPLMAAPGPVPAGLSHTPAFRTDQLGAGR